MPRAVRVVSLALIAPAAVLAGCGNSRTVAPSLTRPAAPDGFRLLAYPTAGIKFDVPRDWTVASQRPPLLATATSGAATVAVWRYVRPEPAALANVSLPAQLRGARAALIASATAHAPKLHLIGVRTARFGQLPAVVMNAIERIAGRPRRVRSIHLFGPGLEVVVEEYAPPAIFRAVDRAVFSPLRRSLSFIYAPET